MEIAILNFPGFYESSLSQVIDSDMEQFIEYRSEEQESEYPKPLQVDLSRVVWDGNFLNYAIAQEHIAESWLADFDSYAGSELDMKRNMWIYSWADKRKKRHKVDSIGLRFAAIDSPKYYNFQTDRLICDISLTTLRRLFALSRAENHKRFEAEIRRRFTSRDGFISFYSNRLADWLEKPLAEYDHNEAGTLLAALVEALVEDGDSSYYWGIEDSYSAFDKAFDFSGFDAAVMEKRAELLRQWLDSDDRESALRWRANHTEAFRAIVAADPDSFPDSDESGGFYRCPETPDMFQHEAQ